MALADTAVRNAKLNPKAVKLAEEKSYFSLLRLLARNTGGKNAASTVEKNCWRVVSTRYNPQGSARTARHGSQAASQWDWLG